MPSIHAFPFIAWTGALLLPTAKGSRISRVSTSALVADAISAWLLTTQYAALVSASAGYVVITPGGTPIAGVRVIGVTITRLRKVLVRADDDALPRTYELDASWELAI